MKSEIRKFEALYLTIIILLLLTFTVVITYQHIAPIFHEQEMHNDQRKRLAKNQNLIINDEDWQIYLNHKKGNSSDGQRQILNKWKKKRDERN